ncbi:MAG: HEPN domain-containing protein [Desulfobacterales bacterium]|nr:HEPN domain-containing protein [Desulfobacterales bacterium]
MNNLADHDLDTAEILFASGKYDWCLFLGHLVLEKGLKSIYVRDNQNNLPPRTHNLLKLAENICILVVPIIFCVSMFLSVIYDFQDDADYICVILTKGNK